jgi:hypothetical protein
MVMTRIRIQRRGRRPRRSLTMTPVKRLVLVSVLLLSSFGAACVQTGVETYEEFRSAVDSGASCEQLIDIQKNFDGTADESRVAADLAEIGCDAADSTRTDEENDE